MRPDLRILEHRLRAAARLFSPLPKQPVYAIVYVTSRCDARCGHCFFWQTLNAVRREYTLEEFERLSSSLGPMIQITLTGGSPELRPDLARIAKIFSERCRPLNITICMLGRHTARIVEQVEAALRYCPTQRLTIGLSLDGIGAEHDDLRGLPGLFDNVVQTAERLANLRTSHPNLYVNIGTTVTALNYRSALQTARWAWDNLPIDMLKPILVRGANTKDPKAWDRDCFAGYKQIQIEARERMKKCRGSRNGLFGTAVHAKELVQRELIAEIFATGRSPVSCSAARETAVIWPNGDVGGCEMRREPLGNLRNTGMDFARIWFGEKADAFRRTICQVEECRGCYHHCFITPAIFRSPTMWGRLARRTWDVIRSGREACDLQS